MSIRLRRLNFVMTLFLIGVSVYYFFLHWGVLIHIELTSSEIIISGLFDGITTILSIYFLVINFWVNKKKFLIKKKDQFYFFLFLAWTGVCTISLILGFAYGHPMLDVVGDYYKFISFPLVFFLIYFATNSEMEISTWYISLAIIWSFSVLLQVIVFHSDILKGERLVSYNIILGSFFFLITIFFVMFYNIPKWLFLFLISAAILSVFCVIISQLRAALIFIPVEIILLILFKAKIEQKFKNVKQKLYLYLVLFSVFGGAFIFKSSYKYFFHRILTIFKSKGILLGILSQMGTRIPQLLIILNSFFHDPAKIWLGFGMGKGLHSSLYPSWAPNLAFFEMFGGLAGQRFIEIMPAEILYKTGLVNLLLFLTFNFFVLKYSFSKITSNRFYILVFIMALIATISFTYGGITFMGYVLYIPAFVGMLKAGEETV